MPHTNSNTNYYSDDTPLWAYENVAFEECEGFFDDKAVGRPSHSLPSQHHPQTPSASYSRRPHVSTLGDINSLPPYNKAIKKSTIPPGYDRSFLYNSDPHLIVGETDRAAFPPRERQVFSHQTPPKTVPAHQSGFENNNPQTRPPRPPNFANNTPSRTPHRPNAATPANFHSPPSTSNTLAPGWQSNIPAPPVSYPQPNFGTNFVPETVEQKVSLLDQARASNSSPRVNKSVGRQKSYPMRGGEAAMDEDGDLPIAQRRVKRQAAINHAFIRDGNGNGWSNK